LQLISTFLEPSSGSVAFYAGSEKVPLEQVHRFFSVAAPYLDFIPHFSIDEQILFTERVKGLSDQFTIEDVLKIMELEAHRNKRLSELSSGMKQRVRLVVSLSANVPFVFLDEPTTNLDDRSKQWYLETVRHLGGSKGLIIASNDELDLETCTTSFNVEDYKVRL
jgi:ABC-type multidrug transport system ATPase subunit